MCTYESVIKRLGQINVRRKKFEKNYWLKCKLSRVPSYRVLRAFPRKLFQDVY